MNHPNRRRDNSGVPTAAEILAKRTEAGLTQAEAAALVRTVLRVWQQWEYGERRMHPAFYELFLLKSQRQAQGVEATQVTP